MSDLDGDNRTDVATSRLSGSTLNIKIRLSGADLRVWLRIPVGTETGLQLTAYDVDYDGRVDLILNRASSISPVAVWLNKPNGRFEENTEWVVPPLEREAAEHLQRRSRRQPQREVVIFSDALPLQETANTVCHRLTDQGRHAPETPLFLRNESVFGFYQRGPPRS